MRKGGYQILDFSKWTFTNGVGIANIGSEFYNIINKCKKQFLISGVTVGNKIYKDFFVTNITKEENVSTHIITYSLYCSDIFISVTSAGTITVTEVVEKPIADIINLDFKNTQIPTTGSTVKITGIFSELSKSSIFIGKNIKIGSASLQQQILLFTNPISSSAYEATVVTPNGTNYKLTVQSTNMVSATVVT